MISAFLGISADGFIGSSSNEPAKFSSKADLQRIRRNLNYYDFVVMGRTTLEAYGSTLTPTNRNIPQYIYTRNENLDFSKYPKFLKQVTAYSTVQDLWSMRRYNIACLGGAKLVSDLHDLGLLDIINITVSPIKLKSGVKLPNIPTQPIAMQKIAGTNEINYTYKVKQFHR